MELPELALERQVDWWLQKIPLAVGGRSHVGWHIDRTDRVTGADQEVSKSLGDTSGCVALPLLYLVTAKIKYIITVTVIMCFPYNVNILSWRDFIQTCSWL